MALKVEAGFGAPAAFADGSIELAEDDGRRLVAPIKERVANAGLFQERWTLRRPTATFDADVVQQRGSSVAGNVMLPQL
jgi:hypothetical protein